jgi:hypothetical protein
MIGGISWPPVDAIASVAAARSGAMPARRIRGMVNTPVAVTLATALPETVPIRLEPTIATLAPPPREVPTRRKARSMNSWPPPIAP